MPPFEHAPYTKFPEQLGADKQDIPYEAVYTASPAKKLANPIFSKKTFAERTAHETDKVREWEDTVWAPKGRSGMFNGGQVAVYTRPDKEDSFKVVANDFKTVSASRRTAAVDGAKRPDNLTLRDHFNVGVIILCVTADGKLLVNVNKKEEKPTNLQFPGGFIGGDPNVGGGELVTKIKQDGAAGLFEAVTSTALKEGKEEILKGFKESHPDQLCLGYIGKTLKWPKKGDKEPKDRFSIKSFVVLSRSQMTFDELVAARAAALPKDADELPNLIALDLNSLKAKQPNERIKVGKKDQETEIPFVAEHGFVLPLLQAHMQSKEAGMAR